MFYQIALLRTKLESLSKITSLKTRFKYSCSLIWNLQIWCLLSSPVTSTLSYYSEILFRVLQLVLSFWKKSSIPNRSSSSWYDAVMFHPSPSGDSCHSYESSSFRRFALFIHLSVISSFSLWTVSSNTAFRSMSGSFFLLLALFFSKDVVSRDQSSLSV